MRRIMMLVAVALAMVAMMSLSGVALAQDVFPILNVGSTFDCTGQPDDPDNCHLRHHQVFVPSPGETSISNFGVNLNDSFGNGHSSGDVGSSQAPNPSGTGFHCPNPGDPCVGGGTSNAPELPPEG